MKVKTISFGLTRNLGNYESARLDMLAELEDWEDYQESFRILKVMVANQVGSSDADIASMTDQDLKLSDELKNLLSTVRSKQTEIESLKREARSLDREIQRLINFKGLVCSLQSQIETVTKGTNEFNEYIGSTARNLSEMEVIWNGVMPPVEGEPMEESAPIPIADNVDEEKEQEEYDPIPFDNGDYANNSLVPYDEF